MEIDKKLIEYLEELSCLTFSEEEAGLLSKDLSKILSWMGKLGGLDTEGVPERSHPFDDVNGYRQDEVSPSLSPELILANAPKCEGDMFSAPKAVDEGEGV